MTQEINPERKLEGIKYKRIYNNIEMKEIDEIRADIRGHDTQ